ncbi:MAG: MoaD/ThiS family protein [Dehalococcoidales bacterium]|nr:MoaD/ThiS family protein [Dehalococcoidales bacterium]
MMSIPVAIFYPQLTRNIEKPESLMVIGSTVGECLQDLVRQFPGVKNWLFDESGRLPAHVHVFINAESASKVSLDAPVRDGDKLIIAALATGG